jgi:predicted nucleic acid-binding protein
VKHLDTDVFVRFLVQPASEQDGHFNRLAGDILGSNQASGEEFTATDAVIAEVVYVLQSHLYQLTREEVQQRLMTVLSRSNCLLPSRHSVIDALEIWVEQPKLSFVDAHLLCVARREAAPLVTFDTALAKAAGTQR